MISHQISVLPLYIVCPLDGAVSPMLIVYSSKIIIQGILIEMLLSLVCINELIMCQNRYEHRIEAMTSSSGLRGFSNGMDLFWIICIFGRDTRIHWSEWSGRTGTTTFRHYSTTLWCYIYNKYHPKHSRFPEFHVKPKEKYQNRLTAVLKLQNQSNRWPVLQ